MQGCFEGLDYVVFPHRGRGGGGGGGVIVVEERRRFIGIRDDCEVFDIFQDLLSGAVEVGDGGSDGLMGVFPVRDGVGWYVGIFLDFSAGLVDLRGDGEDGLGCGLEGFDAALGCGEGDLVVEF